MTLGLLVFFAVLVTLADLVSAWLFTLDPAHFGITIIHRSRDALMLGLALWGLRRAHQAGLIFFVGLLYLCWIAAYFVASSGELDQMIVLASAAKLALPLLLLSAGYGCLETPQRLTVFALAVAALTIASTAFGAWDINHTEFWLETVEYGHYLNGVKGIVTGFDGYYVLPFNFFGFEAQRRAAGLVAAPLAQGSLVAIGTMLGFAVLQRKSLPLALVMLAIGLIGVWQSGTRGAMLILLIALPIFLIFASRGRHGALTRNAAILAILGLISFQTISFIYSYSVNLEDGSTIGHVEALQRNLEDLDQVMLIGPGLGASGSIAADAGLDMAGGGEGAIFAIAYQIGVPAALLFLLFYAVLLRHAFAGRVWDSAAGDVCLAGFALGIGITTTFIISDHVFSLSGLALFWIALGGILAQTHQSHATFRPKANAI